MAAILGDEWANRRDLDDLVPERLGVGSGQRVMALAAGFSP